MGVLRSYYLGEVARARVTITSSTDSTIGVDPDGLTFYVKEPDGSTHSFVYAATSTSLLKVTTGIYDGLWPTAQEGQHFYGFVGTGTNAGADEGAWFVNKRRFD